MTERILIIGAGGHAQVVADILWQMRHRDGGVEPIGYLDDNANLVGQRLLDLPVLGAIAQLAVFPHDAIIVAIGDNLTRQAIYNRCQQAGERFLTAVHPGAVVASSAALGPGCMVCAGAVVNPSSSVGPGTILNTGCTVDHHNQIGTHVHIAPGVHLGGEVVVEDGVLVGIGATVMPRLQLGAWSVVGAGACVTRSVPAGQTVVGVPARPLTRG